MARRNAGSATPNGRLLVVFGDQLDASAPLLRDADPARDTVLMMEVAEESTHVPSHIQRTVLFLSAMRHFATDLEGRGLRVRYVTLDDPANSHDFNGEVARAVDALHPTSIACTWPGEWRVLAEVHSWQARFALPIDVVEDQHFITTPAEFAAWAEGRTSLTMEYFYREQRRRTGYLMDGRGKAATPEGGVWNFDKENRLPFGKAGPDPTPPPPVGFAPDPITLDVIRAVRARLPDLPGRLAREEDFAWAVTREQALHALRDFIDHRLANFGPYEDAMWTGERVLYHSALSPLLNLKLLDPRECCEAAIAAYRRRSDIPLQSVEAFVRQIIGWREFIRGVYWREGPGYAERNSLDQHGRLPEFYWTGDTDMACLRECVGQVLDTAFGHHIQRLMVTGNFALIAGVHPRAVSDWYLGMYADGVDWVTLPNALGMVMHADRRAGAPPGVTGVVGTKPYAAGGNYISKVSNYCRGCRYDPKQRTGPDACPLSTFYWDFMIRNRERLRANLRMGVILRGVDALAPQTRTQITIDAGLLRKRMGVD